MKTPYAGIEEVVGDGLERVEGAELSKELFACFPGDRDDASVCGDVDLVQAIDAGRSLKIGPGAREGAAFALPS